MATNVFSVLYSDGAHQARHLRSIRQLFLAREIHPFGSSAISSTSVPAREPTPASILHLWGAGGYSAVSSVPEHEWGFYKPDGQLVPRLVYEIASSWHC